MSCLQVLSLPSRLLRAHFLPPHASDAGHPAIVCVKGMSLFGGQSLKSEGAHALVGAGVATAFSLLFLGCSSHEAQGQKAGPSEKDLSFLLTLVAAPCPSRTKVQHSRAVCSPEQHWPSLGLPVCQAALRKAHFLSFLAHHLLASGRGGRVPGGGGGRWGSEAGGH